MGGVLVKARARWEFVKREWKDGKAVDLKGEGTAEAEAKPLRRKKI